MQERELSIIDSQYDPGVESQRHFSKRVPLVLVLALPINHRPRNLEVYLLDAGHFALDTNADEIAALVRELVKTQK